MKSFAYLLIIIPFLSIAQNHTISGYVKDGENGESLIGATIIDLVSKKGTIANPYGFFSLTIPQDSVNLKISFVGYVSYNEVFFLNENKVLDVNMNPGGILDEVVITANEDIASIPQMSTIDVPVEQIKSIPVLMGEADVLKTIQLLPGIQAGSEGSSGVYVRGGGPDQNLILLDGVPVYNASHLFGFFSVFNPDAVNNVSVMKGGFPARYGGRLSSVIDISLKEGNNKKISGSGSVGLIAAKFTLEGPIKSEKTSFLISARRTYIDILARPIIKAQSNGDGVGGYFFHDYIAKINHRFSAKDRLFLSAYTGLDKFYGKEHYKENQFEEDNDFGLKWGNIITAVRWNHLYTPKLFSNLTGTYSRYRFIVSSDYQSIDRSVSPGEKDEFHFKYFSGIEDLTLKLDFDYLPVSSQNIKFGIQSTHHSFSPGVLAFKESNVIDTTVGANHRVAYESYAYAEDDFSIGEKLRFNFGLHYSFFNVDNKFYHSLQPRASARMMLANNLSYKVSYAKMSQYIHLLTNGGIGLPTDLWVPATKQIRPQQSQQLATGLAQNFGIYEISLEAYYKKMERLIAYKEGSSFINYGNDWEDKVVSGDGTSKGIELLIQKKTGRLNGWIGYTLSKTTRQFETLNNGKEFSYKYDRRHDVSIVSIFELSPSIKLSGTWVYGTGNAITMPISEYPVSEGDDQIEPHQWFRATNYGDRNSYRMMAYHRLDVGISFMKEKKRYDRTWSIGTYNTYNRKNPFFIDTQERSEGKKFVQYSLFPIIPYFTYSIKF